VCFVYHCAALPLPVHHPSPTTPIRTPGSTSSPHPTCSKELNEHAIPLQVLCLPLRRSSTTSTSPHLRHPFVPRDPPPVLAQRSLKHQIMMLYHLMHIVCRCVILPFFPFAVTPAAPQEPLPSFAQRVPKYQKRLMYHFVYFICSWAALPSPVHHLPCDTHSYLRIHSQSLPNAF
jgi:hypothetical protein